MRKERTSELTLKKQKEYNPKEMVSCAICGTKIERWQSYKSSPLISNPDAIACCKCFVEKVELYRDYLNKKATYKINDKAKLFMIVFSDAIEKNVGLMVPVKFAGKTTIITCAYMVKIVAIIFNKHREPYDNNLNIISFNINN